MVKSLMSTRPSLLKSPVVQLIPADWPKFVSTMVRSLMSTLPSRFRVAWQNGNAGDGVTAKAGHREARVRPIIRQIARRKRCRTGPVITPEVEAIARVPTADAKREVSRIRAIARRVAGGRACPPAQNRIVLSQNALERGQGASGDPRGRESDWCGERGGQEAGSDGAGRRSSATKARCWL